MKKDIVVLYLENFEDRAKKLNSFLQEFYETDANFLVKAKSVRFSNGEGKVVIEHSIRNKIVFLVSDISNYSLTYQMLGFENHYSPDDHFTDIKRTISAIAGKAEKLYVVMPLLYESRQHRRSMRESLDCALALHELEKMGVNGIITFDAHDPNIQNAVSTMSFDSFFPSYPILKSVIENEKKKIDSNNMVVISPDIGAMQRATNYANMLGLDVGIFYKRRDFTQVINGKNPVVEHVYLGSKIAGKNIMIVDDMLASGGSIIDVINELSHKGIKGASIITTFAFFTSGTQKFDELYENGLLNKIYATNLCYIPDEIKNKPWLECVDIIKFMAKIIYAIGSGKSISSMIDSTEKIKQLLLQHNQE